MPKAIRTGSVKSRITVKRVPLKKDQFHTHHVRLSKDSVETLLDGGTLGCGDDKNSKVLIVIELLEEKK